MKIVQYNIYFGDHDGISIETRMQNICRNLNEEDADIVCLQEVLQNMYGLLVDQLTGTYPHVYPDPRDGLGMSYDTVIFSKHPIKKAIKHKFEFTTMGRDIKLVLIQNDEGDKVYVCTSHFESEFKDGCMKKVYQYNRCSDILKQIHTKTSIPIFLCADTNVCKITEPSFLNVFTFAKGWRDAWVEIGSDNQTELTFDSNTNPILIERYGSSPYKQMYRSRLDRILHISDLHCTNFKLIGTDPKIIMSDHYGIVCTFSKTKPENRGNYVPALTFSESMNEKNVGKQTIVERYKKVVKPIAKMF